MSLETVHRTSSILRMPAFWLVVVCAAAVRLPPCWSSLPYFSYVDEGHVLHRAADMLKTGSWDPGWYYYPSLLMYLSAIAAKLSSWYLGDNLQEIIAADNMSSYDIFEPSYLILSGRLVVAAFGIGVVILTGLLGAKLANRHTGLAAALFACILPALAVRSTYTAVDIPATFFSLLTLYLTALALDDDGHMRFFLASAFTAGLAFTAKYTGGAVFLCPLCALLMSDVRERSFLAALGGLGLALVCGILAGMPAILWNWELVLHHIGGQRGIYLAKVWTLGYIEQLARSSEVGWPMIAAAGLGYIQLFRHGPARRILYSWVVYIALFSGVLFSFHFQPLRNMLPLIPLLCVGAAGLFFSKRPSKLSALLGCWAMVLALCALPSMQSHAQLLKSWKRLDSRRSAIETAKAWSNTGMNIGVVSELAIQPSELKKLNGTTTVAPEAELSGLLESSEFDLVIASSRLAPKLTSANFCVKASFGHRKTPNTMLDWRYNDQQVDIWAPCSG